MTNNKIGKKWDNKVYRHGRNEPTVVYKLHAVSNSRKSLEDMRRDTHRYVIKHSKFRKTQLVNTAAHGVISHHGHFALYKALRKSNR